MIINFLTPLRNFWKDVPINDILIERFINLGFAELNEEKGKYEINERGTNLLFIYIEQITNNK